MKAQSLKGVVTTTTERLTPEKVNDLKAKVRAARPPDLVTSDRIVLREARLAEAEIRPSALALERILGGNDLVDINYLFRAGKAAHSVCRIVLRDRAGRETGYGTGFLVTPQLLLTNQHVLETAAAAETAHAEFDHELDTDGFPKPTTRFALSPRRFFLNDRAHDFALVAVDPVPINGSRSLKEYGFLPLLGAEGKIIAGEFMSIIQHPSGLPKQVALRENRLLSVEELVLLYESDTAQGSSGAPVFNDSWQVVGLHHSGVPRTDNQGRWLLKNGSVAGPDAEEGEIDWIANEGIRASRIVSYVEENAEQGPLLDEFVSSASGNTLPGATPVGGPESRDAGPETALPPSGGSSPVRVTVPITFTIGIGDVTGKPDVTVAGLTAVERMKVPYVDANYEGRRGYDPEFLGLKVPLPEVKEPARVARLDDNSWVLPYEHFSAIMEKNRRLAMVVASNVDARSAKKKPEPGKDYSRKGLAGLGPNDTESWLLDPRIPEACQLPDRFYNLDGGAFDKGHLVRREDVCWGDSYAEVRRANGDTFHTTNCSPQVADFNRSSGGGLWGKLENEILRQAKTEQYCIFSGPWLQDKDREFLGKDHRGEVRIRIPSKYWKIVVARAGDELQTFAFLLEQDLTDVPLELAVSAEWRSHMISLRDLEKGLKSLRFPDVLHKSDQSRTAIGEELLKAESLRGLDRKQLL